MMGAPHWQHQVVGAVQLLKGRDMRPGPKQLTRNSRDAMGCNLKASTLFMPSYDNACSDRVMRCSDVVCCRLRDRFCGWPSRRLRGGLIYAKADNSTKSTEHRNQKNRSVVRAVWFDWRFMGEVPATALRV